MCIPEPQHNMLLPCFPPQLQEVCCIVAGVDSVRFEVDIHPVTSEVQLLNPPMVESLQGLFVDILIRLMRTTG